MHDVAASGTASKTYQNVMIIVIPMTPLANVAHLTHVSQNHAMTFPGTSKLTALLWAE